MHGLEAFTFTNSSSPAASWQVPPTTTIVWVNPPAKAATAPAANNPPDWIHIFSRVAGDLGFFKPLGPAFQIDSFAIAQGEVQRRQRRHPGCRRPATFHVLAAAALCLDLWLLVEAAQLQRKTREAIGLLPVTSLLLGLSCCMLTLPPPPADCLPWCMLDDGAHLGSTASEVLLQSLVNLLMQLGKG
jgi:hypothetical protein